MFGHGPWGGRARAAATAWLNASAAGLDRLPSQAASISLMRTVSAARRSFSNFECLAIRLPRLEMKKPPAETAGGCRGWLGALDVLRASTLGALLDVELDLLPAHEAIEVQGRRETVAVEEVFLSVLGGDEAETAVRNDLLDCAGGHSDLHSSLERTKQQTHGQFEEGRPHEARHRCGARVKYRTLVRPRKVRLRPSAGSASLPDRRAARPACRARRRRARKEYAPAPDERVHHPRPCRSRRRR